MKVESIPLRFRVWDKTSQSFFKNRSGGRIFSLLDLASVIGIPPMLTYLSREWEISQSTGLKDKNGKEIFVGDVLQDELDDYISIVSFTRGSIVDVDPADGDILEMLEEATHDVNVIGNIWENPELL